MSTFNNTPPRPTPTSFGQGPFSSAARHFNVHTNLGSGFFHTKRRRPKLGKVESAIDLTPDNSITIYAGIRYLEELDKAREILASKYGTLNPLTNNIVGTSGFPSDSIYYHSFKGSFDGFGHLTLVTDSDRQVVAVQLLNNAPKSRLLSDHSNKWSVFNFVQNRSKGSSEYAIAYKVETIDKILVIDSELVDKERKSREWNRLYMPKKFSAIILHLITRK